MTRKNIGILLLAMVVCSSCKKFLDVKPKTQIDAEVAFSDEQGFMDALTGVYLKMNDNNLYGKELSFGLTDVLSKQYTRFNSSFHEYYEASLYNYGNAALRSKIDGIWQNMYGAIANTNNLISYLNTANQNMFRDVNYGIIKGEAYGLRAFMHFDLLRLFAPAPASADGNSKPAIPYMDELTVGVLPQLTVAEILKRIQDDLELAAQTLKPIDPIVPGSTTPATSTGYLRDRFYKMNYYAVKATQARVFLYAGNKEKALECAQEVIAAAQFPFTTSQQINDGNKVLTTELIFSLYKSDMAPISDAYFSPASGNLLTKTNDAEFLAVYETTADLRYTLLTALENTSTNLRYLIKLAQPVSASRAYMNKMPVIRISEMYYIAAECLKETNMTAAAEHLNVVRRARNVLSDIAATVTADQLQQELFKEYRKEFMGEGQLFFYYKRLNKTAIEYSTVPANNSIYVLPLPDTEVEYGNRK